jgi:homoserine dehydrogenase
MTPALILIGYGHVTRRFVRLLDESRAALAALDVHPVIVGVATRRHGRVFDGRGIDAASIADRLVASAAPQRSAADFITDALTALRAVPALTPVIIEATTLDVVDGEPATSHVRAALAGGAHVITANKGPVAFAYRELAAQAEAASRSFLFEGAVMDGIPLFNLVRETMPTVTVRGFRGVVNSTTNFVLTALERGEPFDEALARMQADGIAEADVSLDVDGWDAAAKTAALANVLLGAQTTPHDVAREGIGVETGARAVAARGRGRRLKLVATGSGQGASVSLRVRLEELADDDPLAALEGQANAIELDTWPLGHMVMTQRNGGLEITAYALLSDLVTVSKRAATARSSR